MSGPGSDPAATAASSPRALRRELGVFGATMMGLGSILGTGVFVSIGIAAGAAGPSVALAIVLAGFVAMCNAFSSAQLAADHPVSGGTYEYGYHYMKPVLGFTAGWMFLCAKSASAATAALGFAGYLLVAVGADVSTWLAPLAAATAVVLTGIVLAGVKRSSHVNIAIVSITILALVAFVAGGMPQALSAGSMHLLPFFRTETASGPWAGFLEAIALMFVAYTGYGRIATMGEEVREPRRIIPRAIVATLVVSALIYIAVGIVAVAAVGAPAMFAATEGKAAPLETLARGFGIPGLHLLIAVGAMTAMLGVLLNLILGLSRVLLAMGRRRDMPRATARLDASGSTPWVAVIVIGVVIAGLAGIGSVRTTWSFSAFTVLIYYAITNAAALRLPPEARLFPRIFPWIGLGGCLFLAFWVEPLVWMSGLAVLGIGLLWFGVASRLPRRAE